MIELIYLLVCTHITTICVTLYLHRGQAHRSIEFHPFVEHFMRFWLWLTTGMVTKEWVAVHRKHHGFCETPQDPHSPKVYGIWKVLFGGALLYAAATQNRKIVEQFGVGTPNDWVERNLYNRFEYHGVILLLIMNTLLFHGWGIVIWLVQIAWIPFWAAGVVNGLGHWWGYRNTNTKDISKNISPIDFWCGGEFLHNNHHDSPANPKFSRKWWEFDIGWMWLNIMIKLQLAKIRESK